MHSQITALQKDMLEDETFKDMCLKHGLPWDPDAGYEPRWFSGPAIEETQVLMLMAEPGPITETEARNLGKAIAHDDWIGSYDLSLQEHYWREHLRTFCRYIWPEDTERNMYDHLAGSCTFWMSLPHGSATDAVPLKLVDYFSKAYLNRLLALFPDAIIVAAGAKSRDRLKRAGVSHEYCWAFTRPGCNQRKAKESWRDVGTAIRDKLNHKGVAPKPAAVVSTVTKMTEEKTVERYVPGKTDSVKAGTVMDVIVETTREKALSRDEIVKAVIASKWVPAKSKQYTSPEKKAAYIRGYISAGVSRKILVPA